MSDVGAGQSNGQLRALIERVERLHEERKAIADDISEIYGEAKSSGYDPKIMKKIVADRAKDPDKLAEEQALYDAYWSAVGGAP